MEWIAGYLSELDGPTVTALVMLAAVFWRQLEAEKRLKRIEEHAAADAGHDESEHLRRHRR